MSILKTARAEWLANPRRDLLAGTVVALALIPEAIAFSIIAGVDPAVGLYASFLIAVTISFVGGRPAMISAATGAMALLMTTLVRDHGLEYLFAASVLTGGFQVLIGLLKLGRYIRFVSRSVMTGFVNSLAILIFMAQTPHLIGANLQTFGLVGAGLLIIYGLPRLTRAVPSSLVAIVLISIFVVATGLDVRTVGDMGALPSALPAFHLPGVPLNWETLSIIAPISATLAFVGLLESLLTANLLDDLTDTPSDKDRETRGQGLANVVSGLFGGMAGCAMIGQSIINVTSGARGRLSTLWAGLFLLFLILVLQDWVERIPMAALVAVMIMVSFKTFDWAAIRNLPKTPIQSSIVFGHHSRGSGHARSLKGRGCRRCSFGRLLCAQGRQDHNCRTDVRPSRPGDALPGQRPTLLRLGGLVCSRLRTPWTPRPGRDRHERGPDLGPDRGGGPGQSSLALPKSGRRGSADRRGRARPRPDRKNGSPRQAASRGVGRGPLEVLTSQDEGDDQSSSSGPSSRGVSSASISSMERPAIP